MSDYVVGDEALLGPSEMNRFLLDVMAVGGKVEIKGNLARIIYLPPAPKRKVTKRKSTDADRE